KGSQLITTSTCSSIVSHINTLLFQIVQAPQFSFQKDSTSSSFLGFLIPSNHQLQCYYHSS
ncbi:MAG: hypothetical protein ACK53Y_06135, partial [bacterium]